MDPATHLATTVSGALERLRAIADEDARRRPAPGKWSIKEIVGHLVDSAANNHQRFVRATRQADLVFPGYEQGGWVEVQQYDNAPWPQLAELWAAYNLHLARVMDAIPEAERLRPRERHNLHEIAFQPVPQDQSATLDYFMRDYVGHLEHHLRQIDALMPARTSPQPM